MAITFKKAPVVQEGDPVTSAQHNALAQAFNDRILSGLGDCAWRIIYYMYGWMRQIRNPSFSGGGPIGLWPYADEWFRIYAYLNPRKTGAEWPLTPPGEEEGVNVNSPIGAFVFGNERANLLSEDLRVADGNEILLWLPKPGGGFGPPETDEELWLLAKYQRGAYDPNASAFYAPALRAAQEHEKIRYHPKLRYLKSYGGFLPTCEECPTGCGDATEDQPESRRFKVIFTPLPEAQRRRAEAGLEPLPIKNYTGFCPFGSPGAKESDCGGPPVAAIGYGKFWYRIYAWDQNGNAVEIERLSTADYIEGPYKGGGVIAHDQGEQLNQALNYFIKNFRGSVAQRDSEEWNPESTSFDFEKFFAGQYLLSPALGRVDGHGGLDAIYPAFQIEAPANGGVVASGTKATSIDSGATYRQIVDGFVLGGVYVAATGLKAPATIEVLANDAPIHTFNLAPDNQKKASGIRYFDQAREAVKISFRLATTADFDHGGRLYFEIAELWNMKPSVPDAYVVIRCSSTHGGDGDNLDEDGIDLPDSQKISDTYFRTGCIVNPGAAGLATVGESSIVNNPIHEAMRQLIVDNARLAQKDNLVGYAVVNGKSVLYYKRYAYGLNNESFDIFAGLGPSPDPVPSGEIKPGIQYVVKGGAIEYDGKLIQANQRFEGKLRVKEFHDRGGQVYETDGIRLIAPKQGTTNRWCLFFSLNGYRPVETSLWKEELYDNTIVLHQRAHTLTAELFGGGIFPPRRDLNDHFTLGQRHALISEAPSGYTYAKGINGRHGLEREAQRDFYRSCQIYQAPYEIESTTADPNEVVKVTLRGRLRHTDKAPATITNDPTTWRFLDHERYRTDENGIMDYLRYRATGKHCKEASELYTAIDQDGSPVLDPDTGEEIKVGYPFQIGDLAANNNVGVFGSDHPKGCCLPRTYFVRLVPEAYEDQNDDQDVEDVGVDVDPYCQMELYLRAICGGFVDEKTSLELCDTDSPLMDYTFQNLCFDAIGQKWLDVLPEKLKPSPFGGHSPLPRTQMYAEIFNNFALCVNKLDKVRIELPLPIQSKLLKFTQGLQPILPQFGDEPPTGVCTCPPSGSFRVCDSTLGNYAFTSRALVPPTEGWRDLCVELGCGWVDGYDYAYASLDATILRGPGPGTGPALMCENGLFRFPAMGEKRIGTVRVNPERDELLAVPEQWRDMITRDDNQLGIMGKIVTQRSWVVYDQVNGEREDFGADCAGSPWVIRLDPEDLNSDFVKIRDAWETAEKCILLIGSLERHLRPLPESVLTWYNRADCQKQRGASSRVGFVPVNNPVPFVQVPLV